MKFQLLAVFLMGVFSLAMGKLYTHLSTNILQLIFLLFIFQLYFRHWRLFSVRASIDGWTSCLLQWLLQERITTFWQMHAGLAESLVHVRMMCDGNFWYCIQHIYVLIQIIKQSIEIAHFISFSPQLCCMLNRGIRIRQMNMEKINQVRLNDWIFRIQLK